ncbi:CPBP family intramembrane glutamic endopeptidase [Halobaculum halobium]|uniref:CPBP family intramembrane glutamic endopeptidase n=1 Tax=Halobaculum halobium TaxID=3032281 RepID=A0ABD5TBR4_9EURY|nr:type II CAAX endopeptidase family protein [Halobaculum sp. SYNS20]
MQVPDGVRPVVSFLAVTFSFTWAAWIAGPVLAGPETPAATALLFVGGFGPAVGAVVRLRLERRSVRAWLRRLVRIRVAPRWYLLALGVPAAIAAAHTVAIVADGGTLAPSVLPGRLPTVAVAVLATALVGGGQEEFGWRGYLLPRLRSRFGPLAASVLLGVVWAGWHLPLYVVPGAYEWGNPFGLYVPVVVGLAVVFTWLFEGSGGVLPVVVLLHAGINNAALLVPVPRRTLAGTGGADVYAVQLAAVATVVLLILAVRGPSLGIDDGGGSPHEGLDSTESTDSPAAGR